MGHAVHQVLVDGPAQAVVPAALGRLAAPAGMMVDGDRAADRLLHQLLSLVDAVRHRGHDHWLSVEPGHLHVLIRRDDDPVRVLDLLCGQHIGRSAGAIGLRLHRDPQLLAHVL